jgi:hypothetical protein
LAALATTVARSALASCAESNVRYVVSLRVVTTVVTNVMCVDKGVVEALVALVALAALALVMHWGTAELCVYRRRPVAWVVVVVEDVVSVLMFELLVAELLLALPP